MTVIRPNSISGITSITAKTSDALSFYESDGSSGNITAGVVTATNLVSNVTGNVTGNITGNVTGNITGTAATFTGALTYEDVTNVDSLGIITARSGLNVTGGDFKVGTAVTISNTGIVTAAAFYGDAANLTNLPASAPVGAGTDRAFFLNDKVILSSYTIPTEKNAGTFGPVQVAAAKTVTIPSGSVWTIV